MRAALAPLLALSLVVTACGHSTPATTPAQQNKAVAYAGCLRTHSVPNWPDPSSSGAFPKSRLEHLGVSASQLQAAETACRRFLPNGGRGPDAAQRRRERARGLQFAECMRAHGVPGFPDPGSDGRIPDPASVGLDQGSPRFESANQACGRYRPPYMPSNPDYNAYARSHR